MEFLSTFKQVEEKLQIADTWKTASELVAEKAYLYCKDKLICITKKNAYQAAKFMRDNNLDLLTAAGLYNDEQALFEEMYK